MMEGWLKKKSANLFAMFQNRYFLLRDNGKLLLWFEKQPINKDTVPKGVIYVL